MSVALSGVFVRGLFDGLGLFLRSLSNACAGKKKKKIRMIRSLANRIFQPRSLAWYREAEIKHARLAMLAALGWPVSD